MHKEENAPARPASEIASVEAAVEIIRAVLGDLCRVVMVASGVVDGEISGVVLGEDEADGDYISSQELADGSAYIVIGLGKLPTEQEPGVVIL